MAEKIPVLAEYIWIDGGEPTARIRSKTKTLKSSSPKDYLSIKNLPRWGFDGSSTNQAEGHFSDCLLAPVRVVRDPIRGKPHVLVLCEVLFPGGEPHHSNTRARLHEACTKYAKFQCRAGIEQEYTMYDKNGSRPLRWPDVGTHFPRPQGGNYCGVGADEIYGRELYEEHLKMCLEAGLDVSGVNMEVMPSQAEFQIGFPAEAMECADQLWLARWLLYRLGEKFGISVKLDPKPISGDWNGAGAHVNFSTKHMREDGGYFAIEEACDVLGKQRFNHIIVYGADNELRLTGLHETCSIDDFRWGVGDRGASIRIHPDVQEDGKGYFEDRRPAANMDPYLVLTAIMETVCGEGFELDEYLEKRFYRLLRWMRGGEAMGLVK